MGHTYKVDDSIVFDRIDETLANIDLEYLMKAKLEMMKEGKDTSILDKALEERKRRDKLIKTSQNKKLRHSLFLGLLSGINEISNSKSNDLMSWEEDAIKNDGYESFNFEEEELEDDDYYFDDDK